LFLFLSPFLYVSYTSAEEEEEEEEDEECLKTRFYSTGFGAEREELLLFFFFSLRGFLSSRISPGAAVGNACLRRSPVLLLEMRLCDDLRCCCWKCVFATISGAAVGNASLLDTIRAVLKHPSLGQGRERERERA
jgi:hypothetical protein